MRELPSFYTEFEEVKDPPEMFLSPVSTANIPDKKATILTDEKKEFGWSKHVASLSEFFRDTSWSVYNTRRHKADIVPYFNSILPLLRQKTNVTNFGTQKHCIEIVEPATRPDNHRY